MAGILYSLVIILAVVGLAFATSLITKHRFSRNVFLTSISVGMCIVIWKSLIPVYMIIFAILPMIAILFSDYGDEST